MMITPELFAEAGRALYGEEWQNPIANLLGMNERTVRRIAKAAREDADYPINESLGPVLARHLREAAEDFRIRAATAHVLAERLAGKL